jgi:hypothetical protein
MAGPILEVLGPESGPVLGPAGTREVYESAYCMVSETVVEC